jgi:hypothetical protein
MQLIRIFIFATIIAFVPVLALPVGVETQELVARDPSVGEWFRGLGGKIRSAFQNLGKKIRSIGKRKSKKAKKAKKEEPKETPSTPVESRELKVIFAREDADDLYVREIDDEIYAREFDDDFEAREFDDDFEAREFDDEFEAREFADELDVRAQSHPHPRELSYDILD